MIELIRIRGMALFLSMVFLNAFVDLGHKIVVQNAIFKLYDGDTQIALTAVVNALILLPFILLLTPAGFVSDRFRRVDVMRYSAWSAVALTLAITAFTLTANMRFEAIIVIEATIQEAITVVDAIN